MRVGIAQAQTAFVRGGAEMLAESLQRALREAGHEAEIISIPFKWYPAARIPAAMLACRLMEVDESCGVRIDRLIGLKFPAYLMPHPHKVLWLLHQYRSAYDTWEAPFGDLIAAPDGAHVRQLIRAADAAVLPQCRGVYTISRNVSDRLRAHNGAESTPLYHPPPFAERFRPGAYEPFLLMPSRINESKRQDLVLEALVRTRAPVRVVFMGGVDAAPYAAALRQRAATAGLGERVEWLGRVDETRRLELYARCRGVIFPPIDEDYGYVTLEAMLSAKPVITCADSGGPLEFVLDGETGRVCEPAPEPLAEALDALWADEALAARYGAAGRARYAELGLSWDSVIERLLA